MTDYDHQFKLLLIGDSGVGKSSVLVRFTDGKFETRFQSTLGVDYKIKTLSVDHKETSKTCKLQIWDTAGQEKFRTITRTYYRGAQGIIVVYDVTNKDSFQSIRDWIKDVVSGSSTDIPKILIGNKTDLPRTDGVSFEEGQQLADELKLTFLETSAQNGSNIEEAFVALTKVILQVLESQPQQVEKPAPLVQEKKKGCC